MIKFIIKYYLFLFVCFNLHAQTWHTMGGGVKNNLPSSPPSVHSIISYNSRITISGYFKRSNSTVLNSISYWDNSNWNPMGIGVWWPLTSQPNDSAGGGAGGLVEYNSKLYIAGAFIGAGGTNINDTSHYANNIAKWDGNDWNPLTQAGDGFNNGIGSIFVYKGNLYIGGSFDTGLDSSGFTVGIGLLRWNDTTFSNVGNLDGDFPPNGEFSAEAFTEYQDKLIMGGYFTSIDGSPFGSYSGIAAWNDTAWSALGGGFNDAVFALAVYNGTLYAGGKFTATADNLTPLNHIAKWNGTQWLPVGEGFNGDVYAICGDSLTNNLYAGGSFTQTGTGFPANHISRWNGTFWQELYYGTNDDVYTLYAKDSNLYVGGKFTQVGTGTIANCIAVWGYQAVGIEERMNEKEIYVFPNPTNGQFSVMSDLNEDALFTFSKISGEVVYREESKLMNKKFDLSFLNKGIYVLSIKCLKTIYTQKIVIY